MQRKIYQKTWFIVLMLFLFFPAGIILALINPFYPSKSKMIYVGASVVLGLLAFTFTSPTQPKETENVTDQKSVEVVAKPENNFIEKSTPAPVEQIKNIIEFEKTVSSKSNKDTTNQIIGLVENFNESIKIADDMEWDAFYSLENKEEKNAKFADMEDRVNEIKSSIIYKMVEVVTESNGVNPDVYDLCQEYSYRQFPRIPIAFGVTGNILSNNASYDEWSHGKYDYEIVNGFWNGYPVLNSYYEFDSKQNGKSNTILLLDVDSITCDKGVIYVNVFDLSRSVVGKNLIESCSPGFLRFIIELNSDYNPDEVDMFNDIKLVLEKSLPSSFTGNLDITSMEIYSLLEKKSFGSLPISLPNLQRDIREWYDISKLRNESFRNGDDYGLGAISSSIYQPEPLRTILSNRLSGYSDYVREHRDILIFAIYKLAEDMK